MLKRTKKPKGFFFFFFFQIILKLLEMEFGSSPLSRCWSMDLNKQMEKPGRN